MSARYRLCDTRRPLASRVQGISVYISDGTAPNATGQTLGDSIRQDQIADRPARAFWCQSSVSRCMPRLRISADGGSCVPRARMIRLADAAEATLVPVPGQDRGYRTRS